ncbi:MAG: Nif3-like dinuclear metal center hexameric protein [Desulfovibrionales bacterium]|nr:Nif3-like dinuclear metal center hexameric protein [Desulfovibrionales bacterium]
MHPTNLIARIESTAPLHAAASWDNSGVQIASATSEITTLCVALDPTLETARRAMDQGAQFLLCHHPLALKPRLPDRVDDFHRILSLCLSHGLWLYGAHTSLDANPKGPVNWLGRALDLRDMRILEVTRTETPVLMRLECAEDEAADDDFSRSMTRRNAGLTEYLLWPEEVANFRSQLRTPGGCQEIALAAPVRDYGFGCIGALPQAMNWADFVASLAPLVGPVQRMVGAAPRTVTTVAYCPGSGADLAQSAFARGAQVYLTGDVKYHQAQAVQDQGLTMDVGHFCLEETMMRLWSQELSRELAGMVKVVFLPGRDPFA